MKKLVIIFVLLVGAIFTQAQDQSVDFDYYKNKYEPSGYALRTFYDFTFDEGDTISSTDSLYTIEIDQHWYSLPTTQELYIAMDSVSGQACVDVALYEKPFEGDSWAIVGSAVRWHGTTGDTSFVISNTSSKQARFQKIQFDAIADSTQKFLITDVRLKNFF